MTTNLATPTPDPLACALPEPPDPARFPDARYFDTSWPIRTGDVDASSRLRFDGVARYLQDIGNDNLEAIDALDTHPYWIVRRTVIDVVRPTTGTERVALRRWCSGFSTRWADMRVQITSESGALLETSGFWINISGETGMPTRMSDGFLAGLTRSTDEHRLKWKQWLPKTPPADASVRHFPLRRTDIDPFDHVNNAAYWHAVEELLAEPESAHLATVPHRAVVEYLSPVTSSDELVLRTVHTDSSLTTWFMVGDTVRAVAAVTTR
ncbi:acyl-ACP thioesterase domain-containing protein [Rhodococcus sp. HNM0569]|uniref:acyl-ACP thioesterase domain-containing protein n=1 Tax=Rhodococcus sp. HNM0569 TaxID=2716340 RepID=UPI00146F6326|nr:4-hydroxybenzoyl-CoA thioesterase [Rhodococcus sp. HNM0569]